MRVLTGAGLVVFLTVVLLQNGLVAMLCMLLTAIISGGVTCAFYCAIELGRDKNNAKKQSAARARNHATIGVTDANRNIRAG